MARPLRCRIGIHKYVIYEEPGSDRYLACIRCGKEYEGLDRPQNLMGGGAGG